jgi:hypothetical protein
MNMSLLWIVLVIVLIFALVGSPVVGGIRHNYGWGPSGLAIVIVIILVVLLLR